MSWTFALALAVLTASCVAFQPIQENELRERRSLDGLWNFVREQNNGGDIGIRANWNKIDLSKFENASVMPVPSAYNDIDDEATNHIGWVWYQKYERVPTRIKGNQRVFLRFDSVNYYAIVFVNSQEVTRHEGAHMPFECEITDVLNYGKENKFTVAVNNTLSWLTVPQADFVYTDRKPENLSNIMMQRYPPGHFTSTPVMDFFNYAGLLRPVNLLFRPKVFFDNYEMEAHQNGSFKYSLHLNGEETAKLTPNVRILDPNGNVVYSSNALKQAATVENPLLWWPRGLGRPNLYTIEAKLMSGDNDVVDVFRTTLGFRSITWDIDGVYFNGQPFYCKGTGWHEESPIRGRSYDRVMMARDLALLEWLGVNCFRTTHYPFAEETMFEADHRGFAVIVEAPSVAIRHYKTVGLQKHMERVREMFTANRNHPAVFMWSMANEPHTYLKGSRAYFKPIIELAHKLDSSRPITLVHGQARYHNDEVSDLLDVICVNRYYGWYIGMGDFDQISRSLDLDLRMWKQTFKKPLMFTEYGAEHIAGMLSSSEFPFSSQFQEHLYAETHKALDRLRKDKIIGGEHAWVFADFMTHWEKTRPLGNHKGLFTRDRQPKPAAYIIRKRYHMIDAESLSNKTSKATIHGLFQDSLVPYGNDR